MSKEITFQDITGEPVSGRFEVSGGLITVTLHDGRKTTADIEESMLSPEILARVLLLQLHRARSEPHRREHRLSIEPRYGCPARTFRTRPLLPHQDGNPTENQTSPLCGPLPVLPR